MRFVIIFAILAAVVQTTMSIPLAKRTDVQHEQKGNSKEKCWVYCTSYPMGVGLMDPGMYSIFASPILAMSYAYSAFASYGYYNSMGTYGGMLLKDSDTKAKEAKTNTA